MNKYKTDQKSKNYTLIKYSDAFQDEQLRIKCFRYKADLKLI